MGVTYLRGAALLEWKALTFGGQIPL